MTISMRIMFKSLARFWRNKRFERRNRHRTASGFAPLPHDFEPKGKHPCKLCYELTDAPGRVCDVCHVEGTIW